MSYADNTPECFSKEEMCNLAPRGDSVIQSCGGLYPALVEYQESEMRLNANQMSFATENRNLPPIQYPAVVGILDQGVRAVYSRGVGVTPRTRGLPYSVSTPDTAELIAWNFRRDVRARGFFACSTKSISLETPIEETPRSQRRSRAQIVRLVQAGV